MKLDTQLLLTEAENELANELAKDSKAKLKAKMREIMNAKRILANLEMELAALLRDIGSE